MVKVIDAITGLVGMLLMLVGVGSAYASFSMGGFTLEGSMLIVVSLGLGAVCLGINAIINLLTGQVNR